MTQLKLDEAVTQQPVTQKPVTQKPVTHVIFDLDGLLIDSEQQYEAVMKKVCFKYGKEFDWNLKKATLGLIPLDIVNKVCQVLDLPITAEQLQKEVEDEFPLVLPKIHLMPGVERLLRHLNRHEIPTSIATSSSKKWFSPKTTNFDDELLSFFHHILHAPEEPRVKACKPAPDTFLVSREKFVDDEGNIPPASSCLVFEDSVTGVIAGVRAGMQVVMIPDPRLDVEDMKQHEPDLRPTQVLFSMIDFKPETFGLPPFDE